MAGLWLQMVYIEVYIYMHICINNKLSIGFERIKEKNLRTMRADKTYKVSIFFLSAQIAISVNFS